MSVRVETKVHAYRRAYHLGPAAPASVVHSAVGAKRPPIVAVGRTLGSPSPPRRGVGRYDRLRVRVVCMRAQISLASALLCIYAGLAGNGRTAVYDGIND